MSSLAQTRSSGVEKAGTRTILIALLGERLLSSHVAKL